MENKWINAFTESLRELTSEGDVQADKEWTEFLIKVMQRIGQMTDCYAQTRNPLDPVNSGEYLNIDALFFRKSDYKDWKLKDYDPPVLPIVAVELENSYNANKITYCLWKLLCLRIPTRVLICYQANMDKLLLLKKNLEETIIKYGLMGRDCGNLFVIIGNEQKGKADWEGKIDWGEYYTAFEWENDKLNSNKIFK